MNFLSYEEPDILDNPEDFENLKKISPELKTLARLMAKDEDEFVIICENKGVISHFLITEYIERQFMGIWTILAWIHPNGQIINMQKGINYDK